jgi:hypothetical protein
MSETWPWLALAGLGAFHGLNPGMGWLFAVALGLHRQSRRAVWLSMLPIALGHAASILVAVVVFLWVGYAFDPRLARVAGGLMLLGWAIYHWRYGHRHRVRFGMQVGLVGLAAWSFLMASAHGAGLMMWPALVPLCFSHTGDESGAVGPAIAGVALHTAAMLAVTATVAGIVYEWLGVGVLRRAWVNVDLIWTVALILAGALLLVW